MGLFGWHANNASGKTGRTGKQRNNKRCEKCGQVDRDGWNKTKPDKKRNGEKASTRSSFKGGDRDRNAAPTGWVQDVSGQWFEVTIQPDKPTPPEAPQGDGKISGGGGQSSASTGHGQRGTAGIEVLTHEGAAITRDKTAPKVSGGKTNGANGNGSRDLPRPLLPLRIPGGPHDDEENEDNSQMQTQFQEPAPGGVHHVPQHTPWPREATKEAARTARRV